MAIDRLFDSEAYKAVKQALQAAAVRQKVIAENIANVDTPGYKRADVSFEEELKKALDAPEKLPLKTTDSRHISNFPPDISAIKARVLREIDTVERNDQNNVNLEEEMANLAKNNIAFQTLVELVAGKLESLKTVINEGRQQ